MSDDLISIDDACTMLGGISKATMWRGVKAGPFPKPIKLGKFIARWSRAELAAYIEKIKSARAA